MKEFGNVTLTRDSIRSVWSSRWLDTAGILAQDIRFALRSLRRAKGLATTVVITLALGIGANAAIFSVVRGVLLRPLVNRDEDRLIYIRQTTPGIGAENMTFSVPEISDFKSRATTVSAFGDFSTVDFTLIGLGNEPRMVKAGVVGGSFFEVMGLRPVLGRLLNAEDDGPRRRGLRCSPTVSGPLRSTATRASSARPSDSGRAPPQSSASSSPRCPYPADTRDHRERRDKPAPPRGDDGRPAARIA